MPPGKDPYRRDAQPVEEPVEVRDGEEIREVEATLGHKRRRFGAGKTEDLYLIKWKGLNEEHNKWVGPKKMLAARMDLALACEGHINGYSFLTSDFEFFKLFRTLITNFIFSSPILKVSTLRKSLAVYYSTWREGGPMGN
ncbi:hypothetical protein TWF191_007453 [Orbilia oligospora]|uniref:Chromo domain-containing protein n=1 Tax=Orbilia oligospora TaxID=2813651 RepID=A0A7C8V099_ORBOL|nr:hypothetical protein TWF191_007453 [Orbilia oligospora]